MTSTIEQYREQLASGDAIALIWTVDDVLTVAPDFTREQAREVLYDALRYHDASVGLTWEGLKDTADQMRPERA